jgi:hypothetical protein
MLTKLIIHSARVGTGRKVSDKNDGVMNGTLLSNENRMNVKRCFLENILAALITTGKLAFSV